MSTRERAEMLVLIPLKPLTRAKSRLAPVLTREQRQQLVQRLLGHVLRTVQTTPLTTHVALVTAEHRLPVGAHAQGLLWLAEDAAWRLDVESSGVGVTVLPHEASELEVSLNQAVGDALNWAAAQGYPHALVLAADLPLLTPQDILALWHEARKVEGPVAVLAPDVHDEGTNALLLRPPDVLTPAFGRRSFRRHQIQALHAGIAVRVCRTRGLACDVDTDEDLQAYLPEWDARLRGEGVNHGS